MQVMFTAKSRIVLYNEGATTKYECIWSVMQICFVHQQSWSTHQLIPIHVGLWLNLHRNMIVQHC